MTTKSATWFGVYSDTRKLVDVTPGEFHAQEIANDLIREKRTNHIVLPVVITPVTP